MKLCFFVLSTLLWVVPALSQNDLLTGRWESINPDTRSWIRVEILKNDEGEWVMRTWSMSGRKPTRKMSQGPDMPIRFHGDDSEAIGIAELEQGSAKVTSTMMITKNILFLETRHDYKDEKRNDVSYLSVMARESAAENDRPKEVGIFGMWNNIDQSARGFTRVWILEREGRYLFLPWGAAGDSETSLGFRWLKFSDPQNLNRGTASRDNGNALVASELKLRGDKLLIETEYDYKDNSRRQDVKIEEEFEKVE